MSTVIFVPNSPGRGAITRMTAIARRIDARILHQNPWDEPMEWAGIEHQHVPYMSQIPRHLRKGDTYLVEGNGLLKRCEMESMPTPVILPLDDEVLSREAAREALGIDTDSPVVFHVRNLYKDNTSGLLTSLPPDVVIVDSLPYPASIYFKAADLIIGNSGYNLYWEAKQIGVPAYLVASPEAADQLHRATARPLNVFLDKNGF